MLLVFDSMTKWEMHRMVHEIYMESNRENAQRRNNAGTSDPGNRRGCAVFWFYASGVKNRVVVRRALPPYFSCSEVINISRQKMELRYTFHDPNTPNETRRLIRAMILERLLAARNVQRDTI